MKKIRSVVIDDEASNRNLITNLIKDLNPNFEVTGQAENVKSAFALITALKPEVVFLDIKMPDGSGFALLEMFDEITFEVVFISGFDSYALKAFEFNALDYVLKPIDSGKFEKTLRKIQTSIENKEIHSQEFRSLLRTYDPGQLIITRIPVHKQNKVVLLSVEDLIYIKSEEGCTQFKTNSHEKHISSKQLSDFEFILEDLPYMVRINKGIFVNINFVASYSKGIICFLTLIDGSEFEVSRRKKGEILELLAVNKKES